MKIDLDQGGVLLAPHQYFSIQDGQGYKVMCERGTIWITQDRDTRDIVLEPGESFTLDRGGNTVVHALRESAVAVEATAPAARANH